MLVRSIFSIGLEVEVTRSETGAFCAGAFDGAEVAIGLEPEALSAAEAGTVRIPSRYCPILIPTSSSTKLPRKVLSIPIKSMPLIWARKKPSPLRSA